MKKCLVMVAALAVAAAACGGGGSSADGGLADCSAVEGQALVCGTVTAADGTPIVGAEVKNTTGGGSSSMNGYYKVFGGAGKYIEKGTTDKCLTDANGGFACSAGTASGAYTFSVTMTGFSLSFSSNLTLDSVTRVPDKDTKASGANITAKWLVVMGSYDGVQLLLSQLKGCTLTGDSKYPAAMTGSAQCEGVNLVVIGTGDVPTTFDNLSKISAYNSIFINCDTDMSEYAAVLQQYVASGGNMYFSDLAYPGVTEAFPDKVKFGSGSTSVGKVNAALENANLVTYLGKSTVEIEFDLSSWEPIESVASGVSTFVSGDTSPLGGTVDAPITVGWKQGSGGCVFYTSYHIEGASTGSDQEKVLKYLILNINSVCQ